MHSFKIARDILFSVWHNSSATRKQRLGYLKNRLTLSFFRSHQTTLSFFFFSSSTKTLVRLFCSLFRPIDNNGASTLRTLILWDWNSPSAGRAARKQAYPSEEENEGTVKYILEGKRDSIGRDLYWNQKLMLDIESKGNEKGERSEKTRRQIANTRERERKMKKRHGRQLICTYIQHPPGNWFNYWR